MGAPRLLSLLARLVGPCLDVSKWDGLLALLVAFFFSTYAKLDVVNQSARLDILRKVGATPL